MLRADNSAEFIKLSLTLGGLLTGRRYALVSGRRVFEPRWRRSELKRLSAVQLERPVFLFQLQRRIYWWFHDRIYWEDDGLAQSDVKALVLAREHRKQRELDRAHALMAAETAPGDNRQSIPKEVKQLVWRRAGGRCSECGSDQLLEFDHVIPLSLGGSNTAKNLQLLCAECNRAKGSGL